MAVEVRLDEEARANRAERVRRIFGLTQEQLERTLDDLSVSAYGGELADHHGRPGAAAGGVGCRDGCGS